MEQQLSRLLRKRACQSPKRCGAQCGCPSIGDELCNTAAVWRPYAAPVLHRDTSVAHSCMSYRNEHTQENCVITVESLNDVKPEQDHASIIADVRKRHTPRQRGGGGVTADTRPVTMRELMPIAPMLRLSDTISKDYWDRDSSIDTVLPMVLSLVEGYEPWVVGDPALFYEQHICDGANDTVDPAACGLPLFYTKTNPLGVVLQLMEMEPNLSKNPDYVIMEYIFSVCMMYYTMCCGRWMVKKTDPSVPFSERHSEYIVVLVPSYDFSEKSPSPIDTLHDAVRQCGLSRFVSSVLHHLHTHNSLFRKHFSIASIGMFLTTKLVGNNFMQTIETLHWAVHPVDDLQQNVTTSKRAAGDMAPRCNVVKWKGATGYKNANLEVYKSDTSLARIPLFFSHSFFNPYIPCMRLPAELVDAWSEQGERSIDVLVLAMTWLKASGATLPQEPPRKKTKSDAKASDSVSAKIEKAKEVLTRYYDAYEDTVSEKSRHWPVEADVENQDRENEVETVLNRVRLLIVRLSMCSQQKCSMVFTVAIQGRFETLELLGVKYARTVGWNHEQPHMWPSLPRYRHTQSMYIDRGPKYCYARLYLPQLCQPGWHHGSRTFSFDWCMPVTGIMGMSPSGLKWCVHRGWNTDLQDAMQAGKQRYNEHQYSIVETLIIERYLKQPHSCNRYIAWSALELLLGDEVLTARAMWLLVYGINTVPTDERIHDLLDSIIAAHHTYIAEEVLANPVSHEFFKGLFERYTYDTVVTPEPEDLQQLINEQSLAAIVAQEFEGVEVVKGGESSLLEEALQAMCAGQNPVDSVAQQDDSYVEHQGERVKLSFFYNALQVKAFTLYVYPSLLVWYTCMRADGVTMHDQRSWVSHLVTLDAYAVLLQQSRCITNMYLNKQTQKLIRGLLQHVVHAPDTEEPLSPSLRLVLQFTRLVMQDESDVTKNLPTTLRKAVEEYQKVVNKREEEIQQALMAQPFSASHIVAAWTALERLGLTNPHQHIAKWLHTSRRGDNTTRRNFLHHNHTDIRVQGVATQLMTLLS